MNRWDEIEREATPAFIPEFGPLNGVRILTTGQMIAMPVAASMLADFGAEVVFLERPALGDGTRNAFPYATNDTGETVSTCWIQDGRNRLSITLESNLNIPEAKEVFFSLIKNVDVWMENMVWTEKLGICDEELLEVNPSLVICHVSGYGRKEFGGEDKYFGRTALDIVGQAASGWLIQNGDIGSAPMRGNPGLGDYSTAYMAVSAVLLAYIHALKTGEGQVVDVSMFEAQAKFTQDYISAWANADYLKERSGTKQFNFQPYDVFKAKDKYVVVGCYGPVLYKRCLDAMNISIDEFPYEDCAVSPETLNSKIGLELDRLVREWISKRTAAEVEDVLTSKKIPAQTVLDARDIMGNEHWIDRGNIVKYKDETLKKEVSALGIIPKMNKTPGKVWRGSPTLGQDTETVLSKLCGYTAEELSALKEKGII